ncbi:NXPE family member 4-like [Mizuhopecten yessoensis]|uniref:NXPE family member 4 n=1 Tax=Mizuhopecten yessoensis TaxID=6573 RepID=A0A210QS30_MIZYE|nr:NXPE family member 4-like [Mizuhopecten yessoensis]OWF51519.1 NXPE family member 4 [Mizuhopecten yessoensis]
MVMEVCLRKKKWTFVLTPYRIILGIVAILFISSNMVLYRSSMFVIQKPQETPNSLLDARQKENRKITTRMSASHRNFSKTVKTFSSSFLRPDQINDVSRNISQNRFSLEENAELKLESNSQYFWKEGTIKVLEEFIKQLEINRTRKERKKLLSDAIQIIKSKKKVVDNNTSASFRWSIVRLKNPLKKSYQVGDRFRVTIHLKDQLGRNIPRGGDVLRIWMKEASTYSNVNGVIIDNGNGTFSGEVLLPWAGQPTIYVALSHTREAVQSVTKAINKYGVLNKMFALFENNEKTAKESVPCGPLPVFSLDEKRMCNLTRQNYGYRWFSARPSSEKLSCDDWTAIRGTNNITVPDRVANRIRYTQHQLIGEGIQITVKGDRGSIMKKNTTLCSRRPRENAWKEPTPSGFFYQNKWKITTCHSDLTQTVRNYHKCLLGRHLMIMGDSNTRSFVMMVTDMLQMRYRTRPMPVGSWHEFTFAENQYNNSVSWYPHESPFFANFFIPKYKLQPISKHLDEIGAGNNSVIVIHLWGHFMRIPYDVFRIHVRKIRNSVENLLMRSPDVDVVVKGPHAMTYYDWITPVDSIWQEHKKIWFDEFKGLHDKVLFLNFWDMAVGTENVDIHPSWQVVMSQMHVLMEYLCDNSYK